MSTPLYTIGFTRKGAERFFCMLSDAGAQIVLDTRAHPDSQLAGFARGKDLGWLLWRLCAIRYLPVPALAPGKALLADYRNKLIDWPGYEARYLAELDQAKVVQQLSGVSLEGACLLCAEETPEQCHRRLAAEWLQQRNPGLVLHHLV